MSRPRGHEQQHGAGFVGEDRVQDILTICPATMGSGLESLLSETESNGRLRARAVQRIKSLLEQVKQNIKVGEGEERVRAGFGAAVQERLVVACRARCLRALTWNEGACACHVLVAA